MIVCSASMNRQWFCRPRWAHYDHAFLIEVKSILFAWWLFWRDKNPDSREILKNSYHAVYCKYWRYWKGAVIWIWKTKNGKYEYTRISVSRERQRSLSSILIDLNRNIHKQRRLRRLRRACPSCRLRARLDDRPCIPAARSFRNSGTLFELAPPLLSSTWATWATL